jgi:Ni/Co efflux regulator RcnB
MPPSYFRRRAPHMPAVAAWARRCEDRGMGRLLALVLGLAALAFAAKVMLAGTTAASSAGPTQPKRQLDNVRARAKQLEREQQKNVDEIARKAAEQ